MKETQQNIYVLKQCSKNLHYEKIGNIHLQHPSSMLEGMNNAKLSVHSQCMNIQIMVKSFL